MAVETKPAGAVADHKEMLISGSEACAEALTLADLDVVTAYPIRPYDTVMQAIAKKIANESVAKDRFTKANWGNCIYLLLSRRDRRNLGLDQVWWSAETSNERIFPQKQKSFQRQEEKHLLQK